MVISKSTKWMESDDLFQGIVPSGYCENSYPLEMATETLPEEWATFGLREILRLYMMNQLCAHWMKSRNPAVWLIRILILFILLLDFQKRRVMLVNSSVYK